MADPWWCMCCCSLCLSQGKVMASQAKDAAPAVKLWRKKHAAARVRREFRTADEVLAEAAERPAAAPKQAILDMRGPQVLLCDVCSFLLPP